MFGDLFVLPRGHTARVRGDLDGHLKKALKQYTLLKQKMSVQRSLFINM